MHWPTLPEPGRNLPPAFHDAASAKAWLARQPQTQPLLMLDAINRQIEAIDGSTLAPSAAVELLNLLRSAATPGLESITPRYLRKALPMPADDLRHFEQAQHLLLSLGIAYLRLIPKFSPADRSLPLNRAACAFRMAQYCHFEAAQECPALIDQLLFAVLAEAESGDLLTQSLADPDFPHLGQANIAGHLAWAFILRLIDPYRLSAAQLTVANRAISRWRELAVFLPQPEDDPRAHSVDLSPLYGATLPPGTPRWLAVRRIVRKIDQRIEGLQGGQPPEALKLGRELSAAACIRLLRRLESSLEAHADAGSTEIGEIELAFGAEHAYAVFTGEILNSPGSLDAGSASLAHQRLAMFGFDRVSAMPNAVRKLVVPGEKWMLVDGKAMRPPGQPGNRRLAPCLIAAKRQEQPALGIMSSLRATEDDGLVAEIDWYAMPVEATRLARPADKHRQAAFAPAFVLREGNELSLIVPATSGVRLGEKLKLEGLIIHQLVPDEVLERGIDFVRYACHTS